jgi:hypothetical protein
VVAVGFKAGVVSSNSNMSACSYCGTENEHEALHCRECGTEFLPVTGTSVPPDLPAEIITHEALDATFSFENGFHRADWESIRCWIDSQVQQVDIEKAWNEAALLWVKKIRDDLGGDYFILQSPQTVLLCDQPLASARWLLDYAGRAVIAVRDQLGHIAWHGASGKNVVFVFSDQDDYYQYLAYHLPDGEQAASGGVCIHSGYTHIAVPWRDPLDAANAIIHELTHDCLSHLPLPVWLNEGIAVTLQKAIAPPRSAAGESELNALFASINWNPPIMWDELADRHFAFWTQENIQAFWAGTSFSLPGDANELSYSLAEVFLKLIAEQTDRATFQAFVHSATQDDAGQTAAMEVLAIDLAQIASTFLGEGNWRPRRKAMIEARERAGWNKQQ